MMRNGCLTLCHFNIPYEVVRIRYFNNVLKLVYHQEKWIIRVGILSNLIVESSAEGRRRGILSLAKLFESLTLKLNLNLARVFACAFQETFKKFSGSSPVPAHTWVFQVFLHQLRWKVVV
jgi:hypothetical protein